MKELKILSGIDTLYYFIETNENYDDLFLDILDQIEDKKSFFVRKEIEHQPSNVHIEVLGTSFQYLSKAEGYHWFIDMNELFRIGFKDTHKQKELHNIRVQLQSIGIYSIGLKPLLGYINNNLLKEYSTGLFPITRVDLNCFVNYDFSHISKNMFASKKKRYQTISEFGSANTIETIYVGKPPFMLRLYDKKKELSKSKKQETMQEYFSIANFEEDEPIFNVEFEMHRVHLRAYGITTLEDMLKNANTLFKRAMDDIRLIDTNTITQKRYSKQFKKQSKNTTYLGANQRGLQYHRIYAVRFPTRETQKKKPYL